MLWSHIFIASTHDVVFSSNKSNPYIISIIDGSLDSIEATGGSIEGVALEYSWHQPFPLHLVQPYDIVKILEYQSPT